jgi:nicotinate-nucleotide adenylyltransferase
VSVARAPVTLPRRRIARRTRRLGAAYPEPMLEPAREGTGDTDSIGVLGGTFDPPHIGHLWLGSLAADALGLRQVLFMPAAAPPHKGRRTISPAAVRMLMTRLAITGDPTFELSGIELDRAGPSYTIDSIEELQRAYGPSVRLVLVMAADSLAQIGTWREPERLLSLVEWAVGPRPGAPPPDRAALAASFGDLAERVHFLDGPALDLSSTQIRGRVAAGRSIRYLVPRAVEELILDRGLYRRSAGKA